MRQYIYIGSSIYNVYILYTRIDGSSIIIKYSARTSSSLSEIVARAYRCNLYEIFISPEEKRTKSCGEREREKEREYVEALAEIIL